MIATRDGRSARSVKLIDALSGKASSLAIGWVGTTTNYVVSVGPSEAPFAFAKGECTGDLRTAYSPLLKDPPRRFGRR
jgi:hypothetical protein